MILFLDRVAENVSLQIAKLFVKAGIKPMTVTVVRFLIAAPVSWYFFSRGEYIYSVVGLFTYMALAILDWVDGEMATLYKLPKHTAPFGRLIDHTSDRILMLIVLGSILYGGMRGPQGYAWTIVTVWYFSTFFFLNVFSYEFEKKFRLPFDRYPEVEKQMYKLTRDPLVKDRILYNLLYVHNNSITRILFTHNFLLIIGILTNQLLGTFIIITAMSAVRATGYFVLEYKTLKPGDTDSALIKVMRKYKPD